MEILYLNFLMSPTDNMLKEAYVKEQPKVKIDEKDLDDMGYDSEEQNEINKALADLDL